MQQKKKTMKVLCNIFGFLSVALIIAFFAGWHYDYYDVAAHAFVAGLVVWPIWFLLHLYCIGYFNEGIGGTEYPGDSGIGGTSGDGGAGDFSGDSGISC